VDVRRAAALPTTQSSAASSRLRDCAHDKDLAPVVVAGLHSLHVTIKQRSLDAGPITPWSCNRRSHARIAPRPRSRQCRPTRANFSMCAAAAAPGSSRSPATAACSARTARCRVRRFRRNVRVGRLRRAAGA